MTLAQACRDLTRLRPEDRAWILERLSASAKLKLARGLGADGALYEPTATAKAMRYLDGLSASEVLDALRGEPSWIVWAVWSAAAWSWRRKVLRSLTPGVKLDLQMLQRDGRSLPTAITQFLVRALAERVTEAAHADEPESSFERLLRRLARSGA